MFLFPIRTSVTDYVLLVALKPDNLKRIRQYDPAEIKPPSLGTPWAQLRLTEIQITFATDKEEAEVIRLCKIGKGVETAKLLTRGFKYRPDLGDNDEPPKSQLD